MSSPKSTPRGLVLFDLDDTLIHSSVINASAPVLATYPGFATVISFDGKTHMFVAVRPFALTLICALHRAGWGVGFWSAGSPPYVRAIVERLVQAAVAGVHGVHATPTFRPLVVVALDHDRNTWVRVQCGGKRRTTTDLYAATMGHSQGAVVKEVAKLRQHHSLVRPFAHVILIDNLPHDVTNTIRLPAFDPTHCGQDLVLYRLGILLDAFSRAKRTVDPAKVTTLLLKRSWEKKHYTAPPLKKTAMAPDAVRKGERLFMRTRQSAACPLGVCEVRSAGAATLINHDTKTYATQSVPVMTRKKKSMVSAQAIHTVLL